MKGFPLSALLPSSPREYQRTGSPCLNRHIITTHTHTHIFSCTHMLEKTPRPAHSGACSAADEQAVR